MDTPTIEEELEKYKSKYENLQREWNSQQEHLGRLQGEIFKLRDQLEEGTLFCAALGSNLANLLWKSSRFDYVVDALLNLENKQDAKPGKLSELFSIVTGTMESFLEAYFEKFPDPNSEEMQFVISLAGIVANVAASRLGRQFISTDENGIILFDEILSILPRLPEGQGDALRRILLMALYNFSINQNGMLMLQQSDLLHAEIHKDLKNERCPELRLLSIRLLQSITCEITSLEILNKLMNAVPLQIIREFVETQDAEIWTIAQDIIHNLEEALHSFDEKPPNQDAVPFEKCFMIQTFDQPQYNPCGCSKS